MEGFEDGREEQASRDGVMRRLRRVGYMGDYRQARRVGETRRRQRGREDFSRRDEEGAESRLHGRLEASKESWRDEEAAEK